MFARHYHAQIAAEYGTAQLAALYWNTHRPKEEKPLTTAEFMIHAPPKPKKATADALAAFHAHMTSRKALLQSKGIHVK